MNSELAREARDGFAGVKARPHLDYRSGGELRLAVTQAATGVLSPFRLHVVNIGGRISGEQMVRADAWRVVAVVTNDFGKIPVMQQETQSMSLNHAICAAIDPAIALNCAVASPQPATVPAARSVGRKHLFVGHPFVFSTGIPL